MSVSRKPSCPTGYILRDSYKTKLGKFVSSRCIRKTGLLPGKSSERTEALIKKATIRAMSARRMSIKQDLTVRTNCPKDKILRSGYTRRSYDRRTGKRSHSLVAPECIIKRGKQKTYKSKNNRASSRIIVLDPEDHFLSEYGYHDIETTPKETRHSALHKLIDHFLPIKGQMATYNYVIRALNARYILNRNTNPKAARLFKADQRVISALYRKVKQDLGNPARK